MRIVVLVEPVAQDAARALKPANLDALRAPALFAVEDRESGPADHQVVFGGDADAGAGAGAGV